uniref:NADH-ubiquinone oxidoreductase chain 1 n=1 Tax=Bambusicaliscelis flavus TaxID=2820090 RepID=A0A8A4VLY6_9HEMI|nr:NADH dehydrogenase subunit 1 [Bambusicaliscelis flavus]QTD82412.1 NADH dehydrogenase subunit 1 [Bambusicaliscelis flavus]
MFFLSFFFLIIFILLGVAYFTLFERKILGYVQFRKGPNSVGVLGLFQPFSDALKLFSKEYYFLIFGNYFIYFFVPILGLVISLIFWLLYPLYFNFITFVYGLLFFLCCSGVGVYVIMISGWSSNSIYSMLGSMRSVAQSISYEVCFFLVIFCFIIFFSSFSLFIFIYVQFNMWIFFVCFPLFFVFFSCCLAETNRSPFDFSEGESELVSGFNVEYSSFMFSLFFLSEYSNMMFMSFFVVLMFFGSDVYSVFFFLKFVFFLFFFVWVRCTFPRYRYDKLMYLSWSCYLPVVLNYLFFFISLKIYLFFIFFSMNLFFK